MIAIQKLVLNAIDPNEQSRIIFQEPEGLFTYLEEYIPTSTQGENIERVKGCRVKVKYQNLSENETKRKRGAIAQVILDSFRQMKREK